jgi:hypothetical protein
VSAYARLALLIGTPIVVIAFIGAVYLQIYEGSRATRSGWMLTQDVTTGTLLTAQNVERVQIGAEGTPFALLSTDPITSREHADHTMQASHLLAPDDVTQSGVVLAPVTFASSPSLSTGEEVDVYVTVGQTVYQVGRDLTVQDAGSIWVPAQEEADWVALQANHATLIAVRSGGAVAPQGASASLQQALQDLGVQAPSGTGTGAGGSDSGLGSGA